MLTWIMTHSFLTKLRSAGDLPREDEDLLLKLCEDVRSFPAQRDLIHEGDRPDHVRLMIEGWACRYQILPDGGRQITALLIPGDFCDSHVTLLASMDHSIGAVTDCKVALVSRDAIVQLMHRPAIARALWWASLVDQAVLRAWIVNMGRRQSLGKVAHLICEMHARLQFVGLADAGAFDFPLSQEQVGDALGITSVHVNRTLRALREAGVMAKSKGRIAVTDMPALRGIAQFDPGYLHLE